MSEILLFLKLLPQLYRLAKIASSRIKEGATIHEIQRSFERIEDAFSKKNRAEGARMLDDLWMQSDSKDETKD